MGVALKNRVLETIRRHGMVSAGERLGVAVSGGADSTALLLLLDELKAELGITLLAVHVNHQLRGSESDADERFVTQLAERRGIELVAVREDVAGEAQGRGINVEEAGRDIRAAVFERLCTEGRATRVATGHTADDQAETVLAHLVRGTGLAGLGGIHPVAGHVVRPLIEVRRGELREYLKSRGEEWREDATNADTSRLRARIRHRLLPQVESEFQPEIVSRLASLAGLARDEEQFWSALVEERYAALAARAEGGVSIRAADCVRPLTLNAGGETEALARRLVRRIVQEVRGKKAGLTSDHVEQVLRLARGSASGKQVRLPGSVVVQREFDRLVFTGAARRSAARVKGSDDAVKAYEYGVELRGQNGATIAVPEIGRRIRLKLIDWPPAGSETKSQLEAVDRDLLRPPVILRNWRPGDAYRPRGRQQVRKLKRLFVERRIAARWRSHWPVLTSAGRLVWASGFPVAAEFAAGVTTRAGLVIAEEEL